MWGFLSTSHYTITANENLSNKPYFFGSLSAKLADHLILDDDRSIILCIFDRLYLLRYGIPLGNPDDCSENWLYLTMIYFKLLCNLDAWLLKIQAIPRIPGFIVRAVRTTTTWECYYYSLARSSACGLGFFLDFTQDVVWTKYPWGQYSPVHRSVSCGVQDLSILGLLCLTEWIELWKMPKHTAHKIEVRHNQLLGLEPELLILNEIVSDQDRSLHVSGVTTWVVGLY